MAAPGRNLTYRSRIGRRQDGLAVMLQVGQSHACGVGWRQPPLLRSQEDAGGASDKIYTTRCDHRLVEVVDVVTEVSLRCPVGAEILQVQVTADQNVWPDLRGLQLGPVADEQVIRS